MRKLRYFYAVQPVVTPSIWINNLLNQVPWQNNSSVIVQWITNPASVFVAPSSLAIVATVQPPTVSVVNTSTFDFYISTSGSSGNPGTLAQPWDIGSLNTKGTTYKGKRVGLIAGTYGVSSLLIAAGGNYNNIAIDVTGGTIASNTYIGSSDVSGNESPRAATIQGNDNGLFGGGNGNKCSMIGHSANVGYVTFSGLKITGASLWCMTFGQTAGVNTAPPGIVVKNCEFTGNSAQNCTVASGENCAVLQLMSATNALIQNNYFHDNFGWTDTTHFSAVYHWGVQSGCQGTQFLYNTFVNSGGLHGKESPQWGTVIAYNYLDTSTKTPAGGYGAAITGFNDTGGNVSATATSVHHNIFVAPDTSSLANAAAYYMSFNDITQYYWYTGLSIYNNTFIQSTNLNGSGLCIWEQSGLSGLFTVYNNLFYDGAHNGCTQLGYVSSNIDGFALLDYNIYGNGSANYVGSLWPPGLNYPQNSGSGSYYNTIGGWQAASGADAHSSRNGTNPFTNNGTFAKQYQVTSGPAYQTGKVGGIPAGATCNVGAWDGTVTQIGCDFA